MKRLHDTWWSAEWLAEEARTLFGRLPTDSFQEETLGVAEARALASVLSLPGIVGERIVVASYEQALPRALDVLLTSVEETDATLIMSCPPPLTDTFRSRFAVAAERVWTIYEFYGQFGALGKDRSIEDVIADNPDVPAQRIHSLYDSFAQSLGQVTSFIHALDDGNVELGTRTALGFGSSELDLLYAELETQLAGSSLVKQRLTGASRDNLLTASLLRESGSSLSPSAQAALILHLVFD